MKQTLTNVIVYCLLNGSPLADAGATASLPGVHVKTYNIKTSKIHNYKTYYKINKYIEYTYRIIVYTYTTIHLIHDNLTIPVMWSAAKGVSLKLF